MKPVESVVVIEELSDDQKEAIEQEKGEVAEDTIKSSEATILEITEAEKNSKSLFQILNMWKEVC